MYYIMTDKFGCEDIIRQSSENEYQKYCFGEEKWQDTDIEENAVEISEEEALRLLDEQRKKYDELLELAEKVAEEKHSGQLDKGGAPYFLHPKAVAAAVENTEYKIAAYLHDVCEDTETTFDDLLEMGFTPRTVNSVRLLTKTEGTSYEKYLEAVKNDECARNVKIADIRHNMDISRIPAPVKKDFERLEKYRKALRFLEEK